MKLLSRSIQNVLDLSPNLDGTMLEVLQHWKTCAVQLEAEASEASGQINEERTVGFVPFLAVVDGELVLPSTEGDDENPAREVPVR